MKYRARVVSHSLLFPKIGLAVMAFSFSIRMHGYYQNDARANKTRNSAIRRGRRSGHSESAGLNRHVAGNERVQQERSQRLRLGPQSCRRHREMTLEA